jgi:hypothetical protein
MGAWEVAGHRFGTLRVHIDNPGIWGETPLQALIFNPEHFCHGATPDLGR